MVLLLLTLDQNEDVELSRQFSSRIRSIFPLRRIKRLKLYFTVFIIILFRETTFIFAFKRHRMLAAYLDMVLAQ